MIRGVLLILAAATTAAVLAGCGSESPASPTAERQLLDGGPDAFRERLAQLRGRPIVVNQWASWCGPCRYEFPFFRRQAEKLEPRVSFLGVNSRDSRAEAAAFLEENPVPFQHFTDEDASIARVFRGGRAWPTTAFYNAQGDLVYTHQGGYQSEADLAKDIQRYAIDG